MKLTPIELLHNLLALGFLLGCFALSVYWYQFLDIPFDSGLWKQHEWLRYMMYDDMVRCVKPIGKSKTDLIKVLGNPNDEGNAPQLEEPWLEYRMLPLAGYDKTWLDVFLTRSGQVRRIEINSN